MARYVLYSGCWHFCRHGGSGTATECAPERVDYERTIEMPRMAADSHIRLALVRAESLIAADKAVTTLRGSCSPPEVSKTGQGMESATRKMYGVDTDREVNRSR